MINDFSSVLFVAALSAAAVARATVYNYSPTVDLSQSTLDGVGTFGNVMVYSLPANPPTFSLHGTDSITGTVTFANNKAIQVTDPGHFGTGSIRLRFEPPSNAFTRYSSTVMLLGVSGSTAPDNPQTTGFATSAGGVLDAAFTGLTNNTASFTGFSYTITLNATPALVAFHPTGVRLDADNRYVTIVPEPAIGLAMLGGQVLLIRRRKSAR
ncbi:MAG: hypothetical protein JWM57_1687 [Phycisphaerales bacterium]|nr:hypothetical protein [Phycisphaerales bacterium]